MGMYYFLFNWMKVESLDPGLLVVSLPFGLVVLVLHVLVCACDVTFVTPLTLWNMLKSLNFDFGCLSNVINMEYIHVSYGCQSGFNLAS